MEHFTDDQDLPLNCPTPRRSSTETVLTLVSGVLAGITGVYAGSHSVVITVVATAAAILLAAMLIFVRR